MAISYGELAVIGSMKYAELKKRYHVLAGKHLADTLTEDNQDELNAILTEMESRGL